QRIEARQRAYEQLVQRLGGLQRRQLKRIYKILDLFGPFRDTPKYLWVVMNGLVRRRALEEGQKFVQSGRLDKPEDIFWLALDEIDRANAEPTFDLRQARDARKPFYRKLNQVITFPHMIDSRGRIIQAKRQKAGDGVFVGQGISRGSAQGRVKVLLHPREKSIEKGDVLVTYTTDPGWTPLFVNAEAIVLEIGGMLQHGGVVAREYGKPCAVGIQGITKALKDGQLVEVDGTSGIVRLLEDGNVQSSGK
ncbi:MAG: phosphoenolpyruvate synthase, partial [Calditrichaeota bacterium]